jgi:hypothetical protein
MSDLALLDKLAHARGPDSYELAELARIVLRGENPSAEAMIMAMHEQIIALRTEVRSLRPEPVMRRM